MFIYDCLTGESFFNYDFCNIGGAFLGCKSQGGGRARRAIGAAQGWGSGGRAPLIMSVSGHSSERPAGGKPIRNGQTPAGRAANLRAAEKQWRAAGALPLSPRRGAYGAPAHRRCRSPTRATAQRAELRPRPDEPTPYT